MRPVSSDTRKQAQQAAAALLGCLESLTIPVDIDLVLRRGLGLRWQYAELPRYAGCGTLLMTGQEGLILVDYRLSGPGQTARRRFTIAHEAGHAVLHRDRLLRAIRPSNPAEAFALEREADAFAAALLMPASAFAAQVRLLSRYGNGRGSLSLADQLAKRFAVSHTAARRRLAELGWPLREDNAFDCPRASGTAP